MTKLEICAVEDANPGKIYLYPEGSFFKAYGVSAWLLCSRVHDFKVSVRPLKGLEGPLLSVGFPFSSFEKFSLGFNVEESPFVHNGKILYFTETVDINGYEKWRALFQIPEKTKVEPELMASFNSLPVYGASYRLAVEATDMAARLDRNYRYSLGEDIRVGAKKALLSITLAGKGEKRFENVVLARHSMVDVQLCLRLLNDLKVLPDKRYMYFLETTEDIIKQLSNWERSEKQRKVAAGVAVSPS